MNREPSYVLLEVPEFLAEQEIKFLLSDVKSLNPEVHRVRPEPFASMEWIVPTAITVHIAKSYFDGFLKEAGKEHYQMLKSWLSKVALYTRKKFRTITVTATDSEEKHDKGYQQAQTISIVIDLNENRRLKLLFDATLSDEIWDKSIEDILKMLSDHHSEFPGDELTERVKGLKGRMLYGVIDQNTTHWVILDDHGMYARQRSETSTGES